jgi:hypothetical protein
MRRQNDTRGTVPKQEKSRALPTTSKRGIDPAGELVCITLYKGGANEVVRRLAA